MFGMGTEQSVCYVYGLRFAMPGHRFDGMIRYVGKSLNPKRRWRQHQTGQFLHRGKLAQHLRKYGCGNFTLEILETCTADTKGDAERAAFRVEVELIALYDTCTGAHGLNTTLGGDGVVLEGENLERQREAGLRKIREVHARIFADENFLKAQAARLDERRRDPIFHGKMVAGLRKRHADPGYRIRRLAAVAAARFSDDAVRRFNEGIKRRDSSPEQQARMKAAGSRLSNYREKATDGLRRRFKNDPEFAQAHVDRLKAMCATEKHQAHLAIQVQRLANDDAVKTKRSATITKLFATDPDMKERHQSGIDRREQNPVFKKRRALGAARRWLKYAQEKCDAVGIEKHTQAIKRLEAELGLTD